MIRLAFRNLFHNKVRLIISSGGVALALLLILSLDAIFSGVEKRITAYIESGLYESISQCGNIYVEFVTDKFRGKGFSIAVKRTPQEKTDCC